MSALLAFPLALLCAVFQAGLQNQKWAVFTAFVAGWWFPDFLQALLHLGANP